SAFLGELPRELVQSLRILRRSDQVNGAGAPRLPNHGVCPVPKGLVAHGQGMAHDALRQKARQLHHRSWVGGGGRRGRQRGGRLSSTVLRRGSAQEPATMTSSARRSS